MDFPELGLSKIPGNSYKKTRRMFLPAPIISGLKRRQKEIGNFMGDVQYKVRFKNDGMGDFEDLNGERRLYCHNCGNVRAFTIKLTADIPDEIRQFLGIQVKIKISPSGDFIATIDHKESFDMDEFIWIMEESDMYMMEWVECENCGDAADPVASPFGSTYNEWDEVIGVGDAFQMLGGWTDAKGDNGKPIVTAQGLMDVCIECHSFKEMNEGVINILEGDDHKAKLHLDVSFCYDGQEDICQECEIMNDMYLFRITNTEVYERNLGVYKYKNKDQEELKL